MGSPSYISPSSRKLAYKYANRVGMGFAGALGSLGARRMFAKSNYQKKYSMPTKKKLGVARTGLCKRLLKDVDHHTTSISRDELYFLDLSDITQGTAINNREREEIIAKGVKFTVRGVVSTSAVYTFCWAVVQLKHQRDTGTAVTDAELNQDFYRGAGLSGRNANFDGVADATHRSMYSLNADKFNIYARGEKVVNGLTTGQGATTLMTKWVKTNCRMEYDSSGFAANPLVLVYWVLPVTGGALTPASTSFNVDIAAVLYFRDLV